MRCSSTGNFGRGVNAQENVEVRGDYADFDQAGTLLPSNDWQMFGEVLGCLQAERRLSDAESSRQRG